MSEQYSCLTKLKKQKVQNNQTHKKLNKKMVFLFFGRSLICSFNFKKKIIDTCFVCFYFCFVLVVFFVFCCFFVVFF